MRASFFARGLCAAALLMIATSGRASVIDSLYNTGVDVAHVVLTDGTIGDPHYTLTTVPSGTTDIRIRTAVGGYPIPPYIGDNSLSTWIGPNNSPALVSPIGTYAYTTTFDLTGLNPADAVINGQWSSDNDGLRILLNGTQISGATDFSQFSIGFAPFSLPAGLLTAGVNTLVFELNNGATSDNPTALRVEISGAVPEAATIFVWSGLAMVGLGCAFVNRRRAALQA